MSLARLKSVAGVRIPDTALCNVAVDLLESSSPQFLCTHCLRTYIFGSLAVMSLGRSVPRCQPLPCLYRSTRQTSQVQVS